ncbi:L-serine ammonia-lyase [Chitinibacter fontanus]|uniref:L-serine dehydratase n=1 Tax=Chitinibacter fontanus TaxID=1737446 RepID=A0A7D5YZT5_9NEIS|nr:L-serine ammonia-lyase [Chitinibacter fontanus]QLI80101.1 L-serine ammonia-lyase [Chitinibacter fontanus]
MLSVFDLFKIGIGPSSSHTVGPMLAAQQFAQTLLERDLFRQTTRVKVDLYGSLALTGVGHGTVDAVVLGLEGNTPRGIEPDLIAPRMAQLRAGAPLQLAGQQPIDFVLGRDVELHKLHFLPQHANGMCFSAFNQDGNRLLHETYFSVGGGFIVNERQWGEQSPSETRVVPYPFSSSVELMQHCRRTGLSIAQLMLANECAYRDQATVRELLLEIAAVMQACVAKGCQHEGRLPGPFAVKRRAPALYRRLEAMHMEGRADVMLWPMLYAMAVSEENASGGRVVTAPTNGAAGIIPAVLQYYRDFTPDASDEGIVDFLLTAAAIGMLYKMNASISGAEVGCQGEVGVACSMAAGAYCAVLGGTLAQVENAAEIAMEHHLGLTCDPVGGQVQVPCVERNGVAAEKAIKIAQLALLEDGEHLVSLDKVIETMYRTGLDMKNSYKETSLGGLALTVAQPEC